MTLRAFAGAGACTLRALLSACRTISFSTRQLKGASGKDTGDEERGSLEEQLARGDREWKLFTRWYSLFGACARNQLQDRATESITPVKQHRGTKKAPEPKAAGTQKRSTAEVTSPVHKRLRPTRPVSLIENLLDHGISLSGESGTQDEPASDEWVEHTPADPAQADSDAGHSRGVKEPSTSVVAKHDGHASRCTSRRHTQVCLLDISACRHLCILTFLMQTDILASQ
jgi:hypothetical protein